MKRIRILVVGAAAVGVLALAASAQAGGLAPLKLAVAQAGTNAVQAVSTNAQPVSGSLEAVQVSLSGYASPTCTVQVMAAPVGDGVARTLVSETFTGSRVVYPAVQCSTNGGLATYFRAPALCSDRLVLVATGGNSTGIVVSIRPLILVE